MYPDLPETVEISRDWRYIPHDQQETRLFKSVLWGLLDLTAVVGILALVSLGMFYFTQVDVTIETVPLGTFPTNASQNIGNARVLTLISLVPKDAIPAILEPDFASPLAVEVQMKDTEQVIGVSINGDARAYPINILSRHEIVNDVVGGESIAVTW